MRVVSQKDSAPLTAKSGNPNMPSYDKTNPNRPLAPSSASANRGNKPKTPLTPKVSTTRPASRQSRSENTTPNNIKDDSSTLGPPFLNGNNTSGRPTTRKTRFDSISHSPSGTPIPSEGPRLYDPSQHASGLGISGMERDTTKRPTVAFSPSNSELNYSQSSQSSADSKFFFASDAKPHSHSTQQTKPPPTKKPAAFFHANGDKVPKKQPPRSGASTVGSTIGEERGHAKFFHANGTPELGLSPSPQFAPPRPSSVLSTHSRVTSPRLANATTSPSQRPTSPQKLNTQYASISTARSPTPLASPVLPRPKAVVRGQSANNITQSRRTSADGGFGHQRNTSTGSSMERLVLTRKVSSGGHSTDIPNPITITEPSSPASISNTDEIPEGEEEEEEGEEEEGESEDEDEEDGDDDGESLSSEDEVIEEVLKAGGSIERMNELAAVARNERKVLDLEIRNSSLEAINRTLEREMRRQTAELRRYKRLSRSGRLSMATGASSRATSGTLSVVDEREGNGLSDISQGNSDLDDEEGDEEEDEDPSSEEDLIDAGTLSPGAVAEHDLKHRKKDEKRLRLDLSKHQQLLIDSQNMNQSLKKCLGWTEELINEGKRALEYKVKTSDIEPLAPRVLAPDELDDNDVEMDNEGMSAIGASLLREARKAAAEQKEKANNLAVPTETDEQLEDLTQDIQFALFASGGSSEIPVEEKSEERPESIPLAPPTSPWVSTFTSRLQTRS
ncbi:hypothetical protein ACHAPC_003155 [Botrytis cinerea]|uniref:Uncharacterized protein n=1 Tax=Botryotinia fuckeliana (strain BcDW1) TaxID=1290391 RepID=M7TSI4_BOTF1|nr:hypothetical protein BcDW1_7172 [Botrytis cinerea BcDW1]